ncbi:helix-turn-helix domain-containing protein [Gemmobacter straminiformis]|uniref:Helix-turn-helix domain-containing protein n=1 Tax=Paragemmobacter straminiformis TaxID=2045119 RepID=A0A842I3A5_9RHOB|nr:helix-turn-helix domain-containing protein [Gemmobacter straminiformis]
MPVEQVAARFSVSVDTIWRWCRKGTFPKPYHPGGSAARWRIDEIEAYEADLKAGFNIELDLSESGFFGASHQLAEVA